MLVLIIIYVHGKEHGERVQKYGFLFFGKPKLLKKAHGPYEETETVEKSTRTV